MDKLNEKASLSMSLTGFAYEFWSKFMFFSGFGYLSLYVFGSKFLFFSGIGFRQIVREIWLTIFRSCGKGFRSIRGFNSGL